jgi:hypothetical protein
LEHAAAGAQCSVSQRAKAQRTNATTSEAVAPFLIDELCDQSASPASDAPLSLASLASVVVASGAPPSHGVVLIHTVLPASSSQHWHNMLHDVGHTSGTALHVALGTTWLGSGHFCGLQSGQGSGFDVVGEQAARRTGRSRNLIVGGE